MTGKKNKKKLPTDDKTDWIFGPLMDEDKFNEQLRGEWNDENEKRMANRNNNQIKLDSRLTENKSLKTSSDKKELPSTSSTNSNTSDDVDFNSDDTDDSDSNSSSSQKTDEKIKIKSPYIQKIEPVGSRRQTETKPDNRPRTETRPKSESKHKHDAEQEPIKPAETLEQRRARARDAYANLQDLVERHGVQLRRQFSPLDDPDEMEEEFKMIKERKNKTNQIKLYKNIILNIISGAEFLNEKYDPFDFKLSGWSKQVAADADDYTEVLEEIYEKYKNSGGSMPPEIRLLFMIIMSGVTFHLSQALFGASGMNSIIKSNPNIIGEFMKGFTNTQKGNQDHEPDEAKNPPPNPKNILSAIRKHNQHNQYNPNKNSDYRTETELPSESVTKQASKNTVVDTKLMDEQKKKYEEELKRQQEIYNAQLDQMQREKTQLLSQKNQLVQQVISQQKQQPQIIPSQNQTKNDTLLSSIKKGLDQVSDEIDLFDSDSDDFMKPPNNQSKQSKKLRQSPSKKTSFNDMEDLAESLDASTDGIINSKKNNAQSLSKKNINSATKSATRSASKSLSKKNKTESVSEGSAKRKGNSSGIIKL